MKFEYLEVILASVGKQNTELGVRSGATSAVMCEPQQCDETRAV